MGGTFDHLHEGHEFLIKTALRLAHQIEIGLTSQDLLKNKKAHSKLEDYATRKQNLKNFINSFTGLDRVNIVEIKSWDDMAKYSQSPDYDGLIVSEETYSNALKLNDLREEKGMDRLILIIIPLIKDKNKNKISSTSIRQNLR